MLAVDAVARCELVDRRNADVATHLAPEKIVEHAKTQGAADGIDAANVELCERRRHDRKSGRQHRHALRLERGQAEPLDTAATDQAFFQSGETLGRDAGGGKPVLLQDFGERERSSRRGVGDSPLLAMESAGDGFDFGACRSIGVGKGLRTQATVSEKALRQSDATDLQRLEALRFEPATNDEFGGSAADVDDEPWLGGGW